MKNLQSRKWQLTINNPLDNDFDHDGIKAAIANLKSVVYWCMGDEIGENQTPHTHVYIYGSPIRFSTIKNQFPTAHIERAKGSSQQNRGYIAKDGKWEESEKADTSVDGTFEEFGVMPDEVTSDGSLDSQIVELILDGATSAEIIRKHPKYIRGMRDIEYVRQLLIAEENRTVWRDVDVTYICGTTGMGKTRAVMEDFGYANVYSATDYKHPFDEYKSESVMPFDEFLSEIPITKMNIYLDGYPRPLPARYSNKQACYKTVAIISNVGLTAQYKQERISTPEVWQAFMRRIDRVVVFMPDGRRFLYDDVGAYLNQTATQRELAHGELIPWKYREEVNA